MGNLLKRIPDHGVLGLWLALWGGAATAQSWVAPAVKVDTVFLLSLKPLPRGGGLLVYRQGPLPEETEVLLTPDTLRAVSSYEELLQTVGGEKVQQLMDMTHARDAFDLYRKLQSPFYGGAVSLIDRTTARALGRFFADPGRKPGERYRYRIVLLDRRGRPLQTQSLEIVVRPVPMDPPDAQEVKAEPDATLRVVWRYHEWGTPETDPAVGFHVYRKGPGDPGFVRLTRVPLLRTERVIYRYHDREVNLGQRYEYRITAVNFAGEESNPSEVITGVPVDRIPPDPPVHLTGRFVKDRVVLEWEYRPPEDLAGFHIYRAEFVTGPYERLTEGLLPPQPYRFEDTTGLPGRLYFYEVSAVDRSGNESRRSSPVTVVFRDVVPPDPPTEVRAEYRDGKIYITWQPSRATDLRGYWIYRGERRDPLPRILKDPLDPSATEYVDAGYGGRGFKPGGTYYVGVSALDQNRNESEIQVVQVRVPDREPPLPVPQVEARVQKDGTVQVVWGTSVSLDVAAYEVYRLQGKTRVLLATLPHPAKTLVDTTAQLGETYQYAVVALDSVPNRSPEVRSEPVTVLDRIPPPAPENVQVVVDTGGIRITWSPVKVPDLAGYRVVRSDLPNGRYLPVHEGVLQDTVFLDRTGKPYQFYRVLALDTSGNESRTRARYQPRQRP